MSLVSTSLQSNQGAFDGKLLSFLDTNWVVSYHPQQSCSTKLLVSLFCLSFSGGRARAGCFPRPWSRLWSTNQILTSKTLAPIPSPFPPLPRTLRFELFDLDGQQLPYPDGYFDVIHCRSVFMGVSSNMPPFLPFPWISRSLILCSHPHAHHSTSPHLPTITCHDTIYPSNTSRNDRPQ